MRNTASGTIEHFRASIGSDYHTLVDASATLFVVGESDNGTFSSVDLDGDGPAELVFIKTRATGSGNIEVFAAGGNRYQTLTLAKASYLVQDETTNGEFQVGYKE